MRGFQCVGPHGAGRIRWEEKECGGGKRGEIEESTHERKKSNVKVFFTDVVHQVGLSRGYRDSARLLGESCTQKIEGPSGEKKLLRNREIIAQ